ncbi:MAG TPA: alpha-ketoacid dehydrogenase subunit beta [Symbiobacteriaceae bacterium]|nr:alpha-ketoacid dehydrogenase subunit beta [Symbiobacteriaceae bacterium]
MREITTSQAIREALAEEMRRDSRVFMLGEDIGVYGGAFGVSAGLLDEFGPDRIRDTPISEAAIAGAAVGAALVGMRPVAEIQFSDFMTIAMDQLVNQAAKIRYMYGGKGKVPMVLRTPIGSGTGAAAQHSQSLEAWLAHIPGLKVVVPSSPAEAKGLLISAIRDDNPVVVYEHKLLYKVKGPVPDEPYTIPLGQARIAREGRDVTVVAWSIMVSKCLRVAERLAAEGIEVEVVDPRCLNPLDRDSITASVARTGRLVVVHEAAGHGGFGGEIVASVTESAAFDYLDAPIERVAGLFTPIPCNPVLEAAVVPNEADIEAAIRRAVGRAGAAPARKGA